MLWLCDAYESIMQIVFSHGERAFIIDWEETGRVPVILGSLMACYFLVRFSHTVFQFLMMI